MARGDQLARQWKIVQTLISSRMGNSAADIARVLDCHPRTVYRDLNALQSAGFPMYTERVDGKSLWSFLDTVNHHFPIPFNLTELMALHFSRDVLKVRMARFFANPRSRFSRRSAPPCHPNQKNTLSKFPRVFAHVLAPTSSMKSSRKSFIRSTWRSSSAGSSVQV
jgi:hypothetical protein